MLKQYKILVNEGKGSENVLVTVPAGAGERGNPTRITAKPDTRYELQDDLKGKGLGPDQVRGKRVGKNLYLMFEDNGKPDVIIEGYYDPVNLQQVPTIVGKAENGSVYEYIPHDPELSSMSTTLKDGYTPAMLSLGGGPIAGGAFELAGLPLIAAAAGGGLGGLGWIAAGLGAAALGGGGGGGGSGSGTPDTTPPNGGNKPVVVIEADNATDNKYINKAEFEAVGKPAKLKVYASFDNVNKTVTTDDFVVFTVNGVAQTPRKLTTAEVTAGKAYIDVDTPAEDGKVTVTAFLQDAALNKTEIGSDETTLDTIAPNTDPKNPNTLVAPVIHIDNDKSEPGNADGDTYVNATELAAFNGFFQVTATFNAANVKLGDSVTFNAKEILGAATSTRAAITRLLTVDEIRIGSATEKFAAPAEGSTLQVTALLEDAAQNKSLLSNTDSATLKKDLPTATSGLAPVSDTGVGTGKNTDGITDDATPLIHVTSGSTVTKIVLKNITPGVVDNNPLSIPVSIDSNGNVQVPTDLAVGKYKPYITIIDSVKNENTVEGAEFIVTKIQAGPDTNWVQEGGLNIAETSITSQSTNANVTLNDKDAYSQLPSVASSKLMTISAFSYHDTIAGVDKSLNVGQDYLTKYGTFNVSSNGKYTYSLNDAAQSLITGQSVFEEFKYNVTSADGFTAFDVSFKIEVKGANDASTFDMVYTSSGTPDLNSPSNSVFVGNGSVDSYVKSKYSIQIIDADFQQSYLQDFSQHLKGVSGDFSLTLENAGDSSMHRYSWGYTQTTDNLSNTTNHDLLTVMSRDGLSIITLDGKSGSVETNPIHNFYTSTVYGLTARGHSEATYDDTLFLNGNGLFLDLTAATTHVTEIDSINLTGSGANTVKLDLRTLLSMSTTQHQLYIVGNAGDTVQLVGGSAWGNADLASHNGYTTYKNGLDELIIQNTINNITFV